MSNPVPEQSLIFHIGDSKTGSTAIQAALAAGQITRPDCRVVFPGGAHHMALAKTLGDPLHSPHRDERFQALRAELDSQDWDVAIVSSEQFEFYPPDRLKDAIERWLTPYADQVRVIAYVRPHVGRLVANHAERVKLGFTAGPLADDLEVQRKRKLMFYTRRLMRWRAAFGANLTVRAYVPDLLAQGDVVQDFARTALGPLAQVSSAARAQNPSLTMPELAFFRELHLRLGARHPEMRQTLVDFAWGAAPFLAQLPAGDTAAKPAIDAAVLQGVRDSFKQDAAEFDALFMDRPVFAPDMADVTPVAAPRDFRAEAWFDAATLRMIHGWVDMLGAILQQEPHAVLRALEIAGLPDIQGHHG